MLVPEHDVERAAEGVLELLDGRHPGFRRRRRVGPEQHPRFLPTRPRTLHAGREDTAPPTAQCAIEAAAATRRRSLPWTSRAPPPRSHRACRHRHAARRLRRLRAGGRAPCGGAAGEHGAVDGHDRAGRRPPGRSRPRPRRAAREDFPSQGQNHVDELPGDFEYNSFPATSGPHAAEWVIWNAYSEPLPALNLVHNLEHGGIVVQFGPDLPEEDLQAVAEWYLEDPVALVLAPQPELEDRIALTAWTHLMTCDGFDVEEFTAFRDEFRFNGPEAIPPENLQPGM